MVDILEVYSEYHKFNNCDNRRKACAVIHDCLANPEFDNPIELFRLMCVVDDTRDVKGVFHKIFKPRTKLPKKYDTWFYNEKLQINVLECISNIKKFGITITDDNSTNNWDELFIKNLVTVNDIAKFDFDEPIKFDTSLDVNYHLRIIDNMTNNDNVINYLSEMFDTDVEDIIFRLVTNQIFNQTYYKYIKNIDNKTFKFNYDLCFDGYVETIYNNINDYLNINDFINNFNFNEIKNQ